MPEYDYLPSVSHHDLAEMTWGWLYANIAVSSMDLASVVFKHTEDIEVRRQGVQKLMEEARNHLQREPYLATCPWKVVDVRRGWTAGILMYEEEAGFYRSNGIEINPLEIDGIERIRNYPLEEKRWTAEELLNEFKKAS